LHLTQIRGHPPYHGLEVINYLDCQLTYNPEEAYLIFLDLNMPIMNGWEFLEALEQKVYLAQVSVVVHYLI